MFFEILSGGVSLWAFALLSLSFFRKKRKNTSSQIEAIKHIGKIGSSNARRPEKTHPLEIRQKEDTISFAMSTEEGRIALSMAMVEPIRRNMEYQAVGKKPLLYQTESL